MTDNTALTDKKRILIVDDEEVVRISLEEFLEDCNFNITCANCAEDALDKIDAGAEYDAAIVDLRMPRMNGEEFILLAKQKRPDMKFIIQTGTFDYQIAQELLDAGVKREHVLKKPVIRLDTFVTILENIFSS